MTRGQREDKVLLASKGGSGWLSSLSRLTSVWRGNKLHVRGGKKNLEERRTAGGSDNEEFGWSLSEHKHRRLFWLLLGAVGLVQGLQVETNALRLTFTGGEVYFSVWHRCRCEHSLLALASTMLVSALCMAAFSISATLDNQFQMYHPSRLSVSPVLGLKFKLTTHVC